MMNGTNPRSKKLLNAIKNIFSVNYGNAGNNTFGSGSNSGNINDISKIFSSNS